MITHSSQTGQRHIPDAEGRVGSVDNGIFIHAAHPRHVETVVLLHRKNNDDHLEFTWTDEEFGKKGRKATYEEIQAYVQEKHRLHVNHLNIAQIKKNVV